MITNIFKWIQVILSGFKWLQMIPNDFKLFQMVSNDSKLFQIVSNDFTLPPRSSLSGFRLVLSLLKYIQHIRRYTKIYKIPSGGGSDRAPPPLGILYILYILPMDIFGYRRLGCESKPGNLNGSFVRDPVAGLWSSISPPATRVPCAVPFRVGVFTLLRNGLKSGSVRSWVIPGGSWMSSGEY